MWKDRLTSAAWWAGMLGGVKLVSAAFGFELFDDEQVEAISNGAAALATAVGVWVAPKRKE